MTRSTTRTWLFAPQAVLPDESALEVAPAAIALEGATIAEVHRDLDAARRLANEHGEPIEQVPKGHLLSPAFINAHTHLAMACFRGLSVEEATSINVVEDLFYAVESRMSPADVAAFAALGAYESLLCGVGLVWEHYYGGEALAEAIADVGVCAVVAPTLQDLSGPGIHDIETQWDTTLALDTPAWADRGVWAALGPHATDTVSEALWRRVANEADERDLPIHAHVAQSIEEFERSHERHRCSPVTHLDRIGLLSEQAGPRFVLIHAIFVNEQDLALLDPARHVLGFCPYSQLIFGFPAAADRWEAANLPWFVATDAAASNDSMNVQKEMRYVAGLRTNPASASREYRSFLEDGGLKRAHRVSAERARTHKERGGLAADASLLSRVWSIPGAMHPGFQAGVIAPGALANLILWNTTHPTMWPGTRPLRTLAMGDTTQAIANVMTRGAWRGTTGDFHRSVTNSEEYQQVRRAASERLDALMKRL